MAIERRVHIHTGPGGTYESMLVGDFDAAISGGSQPGLLLFPNFLGTKEWDFAKAEWLAAKGYQVLVVDYYGQGKRASNMDEGAPLLAEFTADRAKMRDTLLAAHAELVKQPGVDAARTGALGFCLGGKCVLDLARAGADIKAAVSFHGLYDAPPFPNARIVAKILIGHGWNDPLCPPDATVGIAHELTAAGVDWQILAFGHTGHAFTANEVPIDAGKTFGFQPDSDRRAWRAALDLFDEVF